jgi:hypothetical protein
MKVQFEPFHKTIRISNIPKACSEEQLCKALKSLYEKEGGDVHDAATAIRGVRAHDQPVKLRSLAFAATDPNYKVATAEINPLPPKLHALAAVSTTVNHISCSFVDILDRGEHELQFDTAFLGLTTLYSPGSPDAE